MSAPLDERGQDAGDDAPVPSVIVAPLPESVWPFTMADPSAIAQIILAKYGDCLPLHRQELISERQGFFLPRSTQCGWLGPAHDVLYRIVDAMLDDMKRQAFCISTDATGARVKAAGRCALWHVFVFLGEDDHVVFRHCREHTSAAIALMLKDYEGRLLADASAIYDGLYEDGRIVEHGCWSHVRRYFYKALETDPKRALEALALIGELFAVERACKDIPMPAKTAARAAKATPVLALFDRWIERERHRVDPRAPLDTAMGYYENQRDALHRFLEDGRVRIDNNLCEQQVRNLVLGRHNWMYFANERGLSWYATFRSLIASCELHHINAQIYIEQMLRLAPHWPVTRMLELAPKYWPETLTRLDARQRAIITRPWELAEHLVEEKTATVARAA